MTAAQCNDLLDIYINPSGDPTPPQNGTQIYGDVNLFFQGCSSRTFSQIYNDYCGIPSVNNDLTTKCASLLSTVQNSDTLLFNKILASLWQDWGSRSIPQFASVCANSTALTTLRASLDNTLVAGILNVTGSPPNKRLATTRLGGSVLNIENSSDTTGEVYATAVSSDSREIFFLTSAGLFRMSASGVTTRIGNVPPGNLDFIHQMCVSANGEVIFVSTNLQFIYKFNYSNGDWDGLSWPEPIGFGVSQMATTSTGNYLVVGIIYFGVTLRCIPYVWNASSNSWMNLLTEFTSNTQGYPNAMSNFISGNTLFININAAGLYLYNLLTGEKTLLPAPGGQYPYIIGCAMGGGILSVFVQGIAGVTGVYVSRGIPSVIGDWTHISTSVQQFVGAPTISFQQITMTASSQYVFWNEYIPTTNRYQVRCAATTTSNALSLFVSPLAQSAYTVLLNNGEIRCYTDNTLQTLLFVSSTNDQTVTSSSLIASNNYTLVEPLLNPVTMSPNGLYALVCEPNNYVLLQNVINGPQIVLWAAPVPQRQTNLTLAYPQNYCSAMPTNSRVQSFDNTFPDPRCLCWDPDFLVQQMFNVELLKQNPVQYQLMLAIAPCLDNTCVQERSKVSVTGFYMNSQIQCPAEINICTTALTLQGEAAIASGEVNVDNNCGTTAGQTPCSATCPVGTGCASNNFCSPLCTSNADCSTSQTCQGGICELIKKQSSTAIPVWAIVLIVLVLLALLIVGIVLGLRSKKK